MFMTKSETAPGGSRVVVAEDEALIRLDLVELLTEEGYDVVGEAGNGEEAVKLARELKPDLVVMDVKMPVMDGITAAEAIAEERIAPVVMLTAFSQRELVERAREAGAMAYVVKPFDASDVVPPSRSRWRGSRDPRLETRSPISRSAWRRARPSTRPRVCSGGSGSDRGRGLPVDPEDRHGPAQVDARGRRGRHRGHRQGLSTQAADQHFRHISHACLRICVVSGVTAIRPFSRRRRLL
jgi:CheY-like chemotaxis protein